MWRIAPNVRNSSRVWRVWTGVSLQTCATFPAFGGFGVAYRSKRAQLFSHLEGLVWRIAPNVRNSSRVWRVWTGVSLQMRAAYLTFGAFLAFIHN